MILEIVNPILGFASFPATPTHSYNRRVHNLNNLTLSSSTRISVSDIKNTQFITHNRSCVCFDLHKEFVPYGQAWDWQKRIVEEKKALVQRNQECPDTLIVLQHHPVYTMGTGSSTEFLNFDINEAPFQVYRTERGGEVTYHGPGQLVIYPIINLRNHKMDLHWYLRALEEVVIRVLASTFSIKASRLDDLTGVWFGDRKLAAIGIRVSQWITYHGLALNVCTDPTPFNWIVPCGIRNRKVGSVKGLLGEFQSDLHELDDCQLMDITHASLIKEFSEVFQLQICNNESTTNEEVSENNGGGGEQEDGRLYVGNPFSMTPDGLTEVFGGAESVVNVEIVYVKRTVERSKGFGFVMMGSVDEAKEAIRMFDETEIGGRTVKVNFPQVPRGGERIVMGAKIRSINQAFEDSDHKIYAGNLGWGLTSDSLKEAFVNQPGVLSAKVIFDRNSGRPRGFGFIFFNTAENLEYSLNTNNGVEVEGRALRLNRATERAPVTPTVQESASESNPDSELLSDVSA